jgi:hypothetical protein
MPSELVAARESEEARGFPRISIKLGANPTCEGETIIVNLHGALISRRQG